VHVCLTQGCPQKDHTLFKENSWIRSPSEAGFTVSHFIIPKMPFTRLHQQSHTVFTAITPICRSSWTSGQLSWPFAVSCSVTVYVGVIDRYKTGNIHCSPDLIQSLELETSCMWQIRKCVGLQFCFATKREPKPDSKIPELFLLRQWKSKIKIIRHRAFLTQYWNHQETQKSICVICAYFMRYTSVPVVKKESRQITRYKPKLSNFAALIPQPYCSDKISTCHLFHFVRNSEYYVSRCTRRNKGLL
jgi:hypothetical protein